MSIGGRQVYIDKKKIIGSCYFMIVVLLNSDNKGEKLILLFC